MPVLIVRPEASDEAGLSGFDFGVFVGVVSEHRMLLGLELDAISQSVPFLNSGDVGFVVNVASSNARHLKSFLYPPHSTCRL